MGEGGAAASQYIRMTNEKEFEKAYKKEMEFLKKFHESYSALAKPTWEVYHYVALCNAILHCGSGKAVNTPEAAKTFFTKLGEAAKINAMKLYESATAIQKKLTENETYRSQSQENKNKISELEAEIDRMKQDHQRSREKLQKEHKTKEKELLESHNTTLAAKEAEIEVMLKNHNDALVHQEIKIDELKKQCQALANANKEENMEVGPVANTKKRALENGEESPGGNKTPQKARKLVKANRNKAGETPGTSGITNTGGKGATNPQPEKEVVDLTGEATNKTNKKAAEHVFPQPIVDQVNERKSWKSATHKNRFLTWGENRMSTNRNWAEQEVLKAFRARLCKKHKGDLDRCDCPFKAVEFREMKHEGTCYMLLEFEGGAGHRAAISDMLIENEILAVDTHPTKWDDNIVKPSKQKSPRKTDKYFLTRLQPTENSPDELLDMLQKACKHIISATRVLKENSPTDTVILEVKKTKTANKAIQTALKAGGISINGLLRPFSKERPKPLMCSKCHKLGHGANACKEDKPTCPKCGGDHRASEHPAEEPKKCVNCGGPHSSTQWACPKMRQAQKEQAKKPQPQKNKNNATAGQKTNKPRATITETNLKCHRCNEVGHIAARCSKADTRQCYNCRKTGHIASACRAPRRNQGFSNGGKKAPNLGQILEVQLADLLKNTISKMVLQLGQH